MLVLLPALSGPLLPVSALAQTATASGLLPSWNDGPARRAILDFVRATSDRSSPNYVVPEDRIVVFDQDGTLWVEHPMYTQVVYCLDRVPDVVAKKPELRNKEPFKTELSGNRETIARLPLRGLQKILAATLSGMTVEEFNGAASSCSNSILNRMREYAYGPAQGCPTPRSEPFSPRCTKRRRGTAGR